ncbi:LCP family glycopolymer transferase [Ornithinibacillus contaminans]|uniref:LCP family glycopolymer transferase n=1 Tax=Ornithinibacillus contaminans TaxID=694055 RepID=UPI00064D799D|nr:LCP family protein [Ornithinibacillus contaminans]
MDNKFDKEIFSHFDEEDLEFTGEDREETLRKIQMRKHRKSNKFIPIGKKYIPPTLGTIMVFILAIGVLFSSLSAEDNNNDKQTSLQGDLSFSALLIGEDAISHRSNINILLTYNSGKKSVKIIPLSRNTYVQLFNENGKMLGNDKLGNVLPYTSPESVLSTASNLVGFPIDYYAVFPEKDVLEKVGSFHDKEMDSIYQLINTISFSQAMSIIEDSETNFPSDLLNQFYRMDHTELSIQTIDIEKGLEEKMINGIYYVEINQSYLEELSNQLQHHLGEN